jgi:hypothetical protein
MTKRKTYTAKFSNGEVIRRQTVTARVYVRLRIKPFGAVRLWVFRRCSVFRLRARTRIFESRNGEGIPSVTQRE